MSSHFTVRVHIRWLCDMMLLHWTRDHEVVGLIPSLVAVGLSLNGLLQIYTVFRKKRFLRFLLYLCCKGSHFHKIFRECLEGNKYSTSKKVSYLLLLVTSC